MQKYSHTSRRVQKELGGNVYALSERVDAIETELGNTEYTGDTITEAVAGAQSNIGTISEEIGSETYTGDSITAAIADIQSDIFNISKSVDTDGSTIDFTGDGVKTLNDLAIELYNYLNSNKVLLNSCVNVRINTVRAVCQLTRTQFDNSYYLEGFYITTTGFNMVKVAIDAQGILALDGTGTCKADNGTITSTTINKNEVIANGAIPFRVADTHL